MNSENTPESQKMRDAKSRKHCFKGIKSNYQKTDEIISPPRNDI